jgi:transcriptional regulator with XRE-family HTH domain
MSAKSSRENTFGEIIRREREKRGLTQADLASQLEVDIKTLRSWERGDHIPGLYARQKLSKLFRMSSEELGFFSSEEEMLTSTHTPATLQIIDFTIQQGDITTFEADVIALKYAQKFYGTDQSIAYKLAEQGVTLQSLRPSIGESQLVASKGAVGAHDVLFVGVPPLEDFGYEQIRGFSAQALNLLSRDKPNARYLAMTVHGVGFGLDEVEAIRAQFAGYMDAIQSGNIPTTLKKITIVDNLSDRVQRLRQALDNGLANATYASKLGTGTQWSYRITAKWLSGSYSRTTSLSSTKPIETAGIKSEVKPHVFVAMPFAKEMDDVFYYGIQQPVHAAGFLCERVDQDRFIGDILDRIKKKIETATAVIAELSGANPNVYLEVGYAWGKGRPTILLVKDGQEPKFDVRGQRYLKYERIKDLEEALIEELKELKNTRMI